MDSESGNHGTPLGSSVEPPVDRYKGFRLSPFQVEAVEAIRQGHNVLVSAPTGAGKTLVAEYAIEDAVRRGKRCIYTAPIKALSNQKYRDFRDDPDVDVGLMTGDVTIHGGAQVLIMTTEILRNAIFEDPGQLHDVEYVIFDEVHFMDDAERGTVWEESLIFSPPEIRFICLSATIANLEELGAWIREIRGPDLVVVRSDVRPVPLRHELYAGGPDGAKGGCFDLAGLERRRAKLRAERRQGRGKGGRRRGRREGGGRPDRQRQMAPDLGPLFDGFQRDGLLPALVFSFSRKDCERLAWRNQKRDLLDDDEHTRMQALQDELIELFQLDPLEKKGEVFQLAGHGLGYHHAGMLPVHKEVVERMFTSGLIKLLFTTETFALGINMPARAVVFASLRKFDGISFDYLRTRDYLQMAGRAGRQGIDADGLVISALSELDEEQAPVARMQSGRPEPIASRFRLSYSSLLHLVSRLGRDRLHEAWERSFNQFQHREGTHKARERNRRTQRRLIDAHLAFLEDLGYLEDGRVLTARGEIARLIYGYEVQITELLFRGALENLPPAALAMVFVALVWEQRRRGDTVYVSPRLFGGVRPHVGQVVAATARREAEYGIPTPMKEPDWSLTPSVCAWFEGASMEDLGELSDATPGDHCRTFRMALQLMRQVRRAIDPAWDLREQLQDAVEGMNRDEVDARRQLELG